MQDDAPDFRALIALLNESGARYVLIGGLAMIARGMTHVTDDIDFSYSRDRAELPGLIAALKRHNARLRGVPADLPFILDLTTFRNTANFTFDTDIGALDLLGEPAGVDSFEGLWERADEIELYGMMVRVASLDDLIAMKRAAGRPKDERHIMEILDFKQFLEDENAG